MIPVHIFRTNSFKNSKNQLEPLIALLVGALTAKQLYGAVCVITDFYGKYLIQSLGIEYNATLETLETGVEKISEIDAKIIAFKKLADAFPSFLYVDHKLPLKRKIPEKNFVIHSKLDLTDCSQFEFYINNGIEFYYDFEGENIRLFDLGLFRCSNKKIIYEYFESYFTSLYKNEHRFNQEADLVKYSKLMEQSYIYKVFKKHGVLRDIYVHQIITRSLMKPAPKQINGAGEHVAPQDAGNYSQLINYAFLNYPKEFTRLISEYKHI